MYELFGFELFVHELIIRGMFLNVNPVFSISALLFARGAFFV